MAAYRYYDLSVIDRLAGAESFDIRLDSPNLDSIVIPSTAKVLHVLGATAISINEYAQRLLQVSALLEAYEGIHSIRFLNCQMVEIAQFVYLATRRRQRQRHGLLLSMEFQACRFKLGAAISLQFLLKNGLLHNLGILYCSFEDGTGDVIADGLRVNQSLEKFAVDWKRFEPPESLIKGIYAMLKANTTIGWLGLNLTNQNLWDFYAAIETSPTLESLHLSATTFARDDLGPISMMFFAMKTLKSLCFYRCNISAEGLKFLVDQISKNVPILDLVFFQCQIESAANAPLVVVNWGGLDTQRLLFPGTRLDKEATFKLMDDIAANRKVRKLDLRGALSTNEDFNKMCEVFLRQNRGPSELNLSGFEACTLMIVNAFHQNTSVKRLMISTVDSNLLVTFAQGLPDMRGIRYLSIYANTATVVYTKRFLKVLEHSMRENTTLWGITLNGVDQDSEMVKAHLPMINYYVAINRVGRHSLSTANIPSGIWAHILAKSNTEPNGIFFALSGKPDLMAPASTTYQQDPITTKTSAPPKSQKQANKKKKKKNKGRAGAR